MKIGIDARFLTHPQQGGFKTYTQNLIAALADVDQENDYVLYLDREPDCDKAVPRAPNMAWRVVRGDWPPLGMPLREQFGLALAGWRDRLDLLHSPALTAPLFLPCPLALTLHDMIWHEPRASQARITFKRQLMASYYRRVPEWAARKAAVIITVSEAAKTDIVTRLGIAAEQVVVTHEAPAPIFKPVREPARLDAVLKKYALPPSFVMAIGSADPRKNISMLVDAYARLPEKIRSLHHLVIVWTHHHLAQEIARQVQSLGLMQHCHFLRGVSNQDMVLLYSAAVLFAFPSRYEGFGLPPLEALACGTPVVAANNSSIPEVVGDAAVLFDAECAEEMAQVMARLLTDDRERTEMAQRGLQRAARFSWARCAQQTVAAYRQCVGVGRMLNPSAASTTSQRLEKKNL